MASVARALLGLGIAMGAITLPFRIHEDLRFPRGLSALVDLSVFVTPVGGAVLIALFVLALGCWVAKVREDVAALVMVSLMAFGLHLMVVQYPPGEAANRALNLPAGGLIAYLLARAWARARGQPEQQEWMGIEAFCGVAAAGYFLAGSGKVVGSGLAWASGTNLALHITVHALDGLAFLLPFRLWLADQLWVCFFFGVGTLMIECGFLLFLAPRLRPYLAVLAMCMHLGIALAMDLHHYDWMFVALGLGFYRVERP